MMADEAAPQVPPTSAAAVSAASAAPPLAFDVESAGPQGPEGPVGASAAAPDAKAPPRRLLPLLCAACSLEGTQTLLLPAMYHALQAKLHLSLGKLAVLTLVEVLCLSLASPLWGIVADRGLMKRKHILVLGCVVQALSTVAMAVVQNYTLMLLLRGLNGIMIGTLTSTSHGIVADVTSETARGKAFGWLELCTKAGMVGSSLAGTPLSTRHVFGVAGFRVAFVCVGVWALGLGLALGLLLAEQPPRAKPGQAQRQGFVGAVLAEALHLLVYLRRPTFVLLVLQGCFGCIPWNALGYMTLFFQVGGLGDVSASVLQSCCQCSQALGSLLGGVIGDRLARRWPLRGRPLAAQVSVLSGIPLAAFIFTAQPPGSGAFLWYLALVVCLGLTCTWCSTAANWPIMSEIVEPEGRGTIMAWRSALGGSCAAVLGNSAVGFLAQKVFGYNLEGVKAAETHNNMQALGKALLLTCIVSWLCCFAIYMVLYWTYPRDLARARARAARRSEKEVSASNVAKTETLDITIKGESEFQQEMTKDGASSPRLLRHPCLTGAGGKEADPDALGARQRSKSKTKTRIPQEVDGGAPAAAGAA